MIYHLGPCGTIFYLMCGQFSLVGTHFTLKPYICIYVVKELARDNDIVKRNTIIDCCMGQVTARFV